MTKKKPSTADLTWDFKNEQFQSPGTLELWNVDRAKQTVKDKPRVIFDLEIESYKKLIGVPGKVPVLGITVNWDKIKEDRINTDDPILMAYVSDKLFPIDGWHRIAKALMKGLKVLPAMKLTRDESTKIYSHGGTVKRVLIRRRRRRRKGPILKG